MSVEAELGMLIVVVLKARNLNDKHSFYKQDVFAQISLNRTDLRTPVEVKGGQHPVWDAELRVPVMTNATDKTRTLVVSCWSREHKKNDLLGEGKVDISETLKTGEFDEWVPLMINGVHRGDVYLEMTFFANSPPKSSTLTVPATVPHQRPSKLSPSDRLWRPASNTPPKTSPSPSPSPSHSPGRSRSSQPDSSTAPTPFNRPIVTPSPPSSRVSSASSSRQHSPLPPRPSEGRFAIPPTLVPGGPGKQTPSPSSTSSSPHRHDYFSAPVPREPSIVYGSVPQSLNPGMRHDPSLSLRPSYTLPSPAPSQAPVPREPSIAYGYVPQSLNPGMRHDPSLSLHPSHTLPSPALPQMPPIHLRRAVPPAGVSSSSAIIDSQIYSSPRTAQVPGAWPEGVKSQDHPVISFPVPQRTSPSAYDYGFTSNASLAPNPPAPLPYPGDRQPDLPDPYARPIYAAPPRGRQPLDPRLDFGVTGVSRTS